MPLFDRFRICISNFFDLHAKLEKICNMEKHSSLCCMKVCIYFMKCKFNFTEVNYETHCL